VGLSSPAEKIISRENHEPGIASSLLNACNMLLINDYYRKKRGDVSRKDIL
jgi:hypothetical protein